MSTTSPTLVLDLFAGAGGWSEAAKSLGLSELGFEYDPHACNTRRAAGHPTVEGDLSTVDLAPYRGKTLGVIASPPCQTFSAAGKGAGRPHLEALCRAATLVRTGSAPAAAVASVHDATLDERSVLVLEPLRWVRDLEPEWVALEQVPAVLPVWEAVAVELEALGYSTWTGVLNSADYGTPQTRKRAILVASRVREVGRPVATHSKAPVAALFGETAPWVAMGEALGWVGAGRVWRYVPEDRDGMDGTLVETSAAGELPAWVRERPATTVVGSFRPEIVSAPGYRVKGSRQNAPGSVEVSLSEAGVLQGFPAAYPWSGPKGKRFLQAGNAVPVQLARAVLKEATGK